MLHVPRHLTTSMLHHLLNSSMAAYLRMCELSIPYPLCPSEVEIPHPQVVYTLHCSFNRTSGLADVGIQGAVTSNSSNVSLKLEMFLNSLQAKLVKLSRLQDILSEEKQTFVSTSECPYRCGVCWSSWFGSLMVTCLMHFNVLLSQCMQVETDGLMIG